MRPEVRFWMYDHIPGARAIGHRLGALSSACAIYRAVMKFHKTATVKAGSTGGES